MAGPNFVTGWSARSIAPSTRVTTNAPITSQTAASALQSLQQAALGAPSATITPTALNDTTLGSRDPNQSQALGRAGISASTFAHPDAPAFLTQAVNNLNGSGGFAQQNLTNLLLAQILGGIGNNAALHETKTAAQAEADAHKVAVAKAAHQKAKADAAANEHASAVQLDRLRSNATMAPPTPVSPAANSYPISGWAAAPSWNGIGGGGGTGFSLPSITGF